MSPSGGLDSQFRVFLVQRLSGSGMGTQVVAGQAGPTSTVNAN